MYGKRNVKQSKQCMESGICTRLSSVWKVEFEAG